MESRHLIQSSSAAADKRAGCLFGLVRRGGFTLIELLAVVVIIVIAAIIVVPAMNLAVSTQLNSAANLIAADLEYAKSLAVIRQQNYTVVFDEDTESYEIRDQGGVITHPVNKGLYHIDFTGDSGLDEVDIHSVDFNSASSVQFDFLGSPLDGGLITLKAGAATTTISVSAVTGHISINRHADIKTGSRSCCIY